MKTRVPIALLETGGQAPDVAGRELDFECIRRVSEDRGRGGKRGERRGKRK